MNKNLKKNLIRILIIILTVCVMMVISGCNGCNRSCIDTTYKFEYAYVTWPDGSSEEIKIKAWRDYDGEQIQIITEDDHVYVFNSINCVLETHKKS